MSFNMKVDLSRVQQASALLSDDSDNSDRNLPPEWDSRTERFEDFYERAQEYTHRDVQERSPLLPSLFLRPHERVNNGNRGPAVESKHSRLSRFIPHDYGGFIPTLSVSVQNPATSAQNEQQNTNKRPAEAAQARTPGPKPARKKRLMMSTMPPPRTGLYWWLSCLVCCSSPLFCATNVVLRLVRNPERFPIPPSSSPTVSQRSTSRRREVLDREDG